jgi:hypothetical protein
MLKADRLTYLFQTEISPASVKPSNPFIRDLARHLNRFACGPTNGAGAGRRGMHQRRYWLDYDPVALAVLVIGIGIIELLALSI